MTRHYSNWLTAFMEYAKYGEAPPHMYFWAGVSAVAGALRRKVWIDQAYFRWYPNFYICMVAPPGIVSKTTTVSVAMNLLRKVPGIHFGPDVVTMQALLTTFAEVHEEVHHEGVYYPMSAMTLESGEFGNLLDPDDRAMVDMLVSLWDGKEGEFSKKTKHSGNDQVINPWINLIACTTPAWIAGNFPEYLIGGGFTSRMLFVYADAKAKYVAYPGLVVPKNLGDMQDKLVADLTDIANMWGEYKLSPAAVEWGENWYRQHYTTKSMTLDDNRFGGYIARKQTHLHKLAMVLAAAESSNMVLTAEHLALANTMITDLEPDMKFVFGKIGQSDAAVHATRLIEFVHGRGKVEFAEAYRYVYTQFPGIRDLDDVIAGCIRAGYISLVQDGKQQWLVKGIDLPKALNGKR